MFLGALKIADNCMTDTGIKLVAFQLHVWVMVLGTDVAADGCWD